jgi:hypothetical protein
MKTIHFSRALKRAKPLFIKTSPLSFEIEIKKGRFQEGAKPPLFYKFPPSPYKIKRCKMGV